MNRIWTLVWPEPPAAADRSGDAHARSVRQAHDGGATVEYLDARAFQHPPERYPAQRPEVMVTKDRDYGQSSGRQEFASHLGFEQTAVLSQVAGDQQEVGVLRESGKTGDYIQVFPTTDVEITNSRHADLEDVWRSDLRNRRW